MRLYLDSADFDDWAALLPTGLFFGVTTNPLLVARARVDYSTVDWIAMIERAAGFGLQEFHLQLTEANIADQHFVERIMETGRRNELEVVFKLPLSNPYLKHSLKVKEFGGRVLFTACYDAKQMFIAQALGADYIAPYYGRMLEAGIEARQALRQMLSIASSGTPACQIIVASLRSPSQMLELAEDGHNLFTINRKVAEDLFTDSNTTKAIAEFEAAARPKEANE